MPFPARVRARGQDVRSRVDHDSIEHAVCLFRIEQAVPLGCQCGARLESVNPFSNPESVPVI